MLISPPQRIRWAGLIFGAGLLVASGCGDGPDSPTAAGSETIGSVTTASAGAASTQPPSTPTSEPEEPEEPEEPQVPVTSTSVPEPSYSSEVTPIGPKLAEAMTGVSWRPGCPVPLEDLRQLTVTHWTFDNTTDTGTLIVHQDVAEQLAEVFEQLFDDGYPIKRMDPIHLFGGTGDPAEGADDFASIEADNTSAFNCRRRTGGAEYSQHSYGTALDLNPLENPYVTAAGTTSHPASEHYLDRVPRHPAVISSNDHVVKAFSQAGWTWGGTWPGPVDYQHFSVNGR